MECGRATCRLFFFPWRQLRCRTPRSAMGWPHPPGSPLITCHCFFIPHPSHFILLLSPCAVAFSLDPDSTIWNKNYVIKARVATVRPYRATGNHCFAGGPCIMGKNEDESSSLTHCFFIQQSSVSGILTAIIALGACFTPAAAFAQRRPLPRQAESAKVIRQRQEWFYQQRAYPHKRIPPGARLKAYQQLRKMQAAQQSQPAEAANHHRFAVHQHHFRNRAFVHILDAHRPATDCHAV